MKELLLSKLLHIGLLIIFSVVIISMFRESNTTVQGIAALIGFVIMMTGAYRNGFKL